jgi:hypothetical protein
MKRFRVIKVFSYEKEEMSIKLSVLSIFLYLRRISREFLTSLGAVDDRKATINECRPEGYWKIIVVVQFSCDL